MGTALASPRRAIRCRGRTSSCCRVYRGLLVKAWYQNSRRLPVGERPVLGTHRFCKHLPHFYGNFCNFNFCLIPCRELCPTREMRRFYVTDIDTATRYPHLLRVATKDPSSVCLHRFKKKVSHSAKVGTKKKVHFFGMTTVALSI